ncbi:hypothetical protein [Jiulongibacter sp. NS-SX5]|uniref:hypothetical protein n=1 Tax=Jiulongibacter sp. NS-SX5 TaxID=3463854 RepID=UPI0040585387
MMQKFERLIAEFPDFSIKGKASAYTSLNGHMFSFLDPQEGLCLRLSPADQKQYNADVDERPVIQYNSIMRGYVYVPNHLFIDLEQMVPLFQKSIDYINTLKPKPGKKA